MLPTLEQSVGLYLRVKGSSAWPGPPGTYSEQEILEFAQARAQSVVDYLVSKGIDPARFVIEAELPPQDHWEVDDPDIQAELLLARLGLEGQTVLISLGQFFGRQAVVEPFLFVASVSFGFWLISLASGYWLVRECRVLPALVLSGTAIIIVQA